MKSAVFAGVLASTTAAITTKLKVHEQFCQEPLDCLAQSAVETSLEASKDEDGEDLYNRIYGDYYNPTYSTYFDCCHNESYDYYVDQFFLHSDLEWSTPPAYYTEEITFEQDGTYFPYYGQKVMFNVDATKLENYFANDDCFDIITFNFPHWSGKQNNRRNRCVNYWLHKL